MNPNTMNHIISATQHARNKHPKFTPNEAEAVSIIGEEFGELCKAVNERDFDHAKLEALHVIATCIRFLEEL